MIRKIIRIFTQLIPQTIKYAPHCVLFAMSGARDVIAEDIESFKRHRNIKVRSEMRALIILLTDTPYYRTLFYRRLGRVCRLVRWYAKEPPTFTIDCEIGGGCYLAHPFATILAAKKIGKNFSCRQCTTLGNKQDGDNDSKPTIGDNVTLGANVCIIGGIHIGDNVTVGAGSVVVKDCPAGCTVVGNPARIIKKTTCDG